MSDISSFFGRLNINGFGGASSSRRSSSPFSAISSSPHRSSSPFSAISPSSHRSSSPFSAFSAFSSFGTSSFVVEPDPEIDPSTQLLLAQLTLTDLVAYRATLKNKRPVTRSPGDDEFALQQQEDELRALIASLEDLALARSVDKAVETDAELIRALEVMEKSEKEDRRAAEMLAREERLPQLTEAQSMVGRKGFIIPERNDDGDDAETVIGEASNGPSFFSRRSTYDPPRATIPSVSALQEQRPSFGTTTLATGATRKAALTALASMAHVLPHIRNLLSVYKPVPCVSAEITALNRLQFEAIFPIVTRLRWTAWQDTLSALNLLPRYSDIPIGLQHGFLMGLENYQITATSTPPNHYKRPEHEAFILEKYAEEEALGRISPGYDRHTLRRLIGHYRTAPLNVMVRKPDGKMRVTVDHSFPRSSSPLMLTDSAVSEPEYIPFDPTIQSVNAIIDSKKFQCTWGTFSQCFLLVADAPVGTEAAVFDVEAAFRNVPVHPSVRPFLAVKIGESIHLDHCLNFGASPCPGIWGRIADAMVEIFLAKGVDAVIKWVDDFVFLRYPLPSLMGGPPSFRYDESRLWSIAEQLGWPWALEKCTSFNSSFTYIGFLWDLVNKTVSLPEQKKLKYLDMLEPWTANFQPTCAEVEVLLGTLNHVMLVVPTGKVRLFHLHQLHASFDDSRHRCPLNSAVLEDISWWRSKLQEPFLGMDVTRPLPPTNDKIFVDASTDWGIGVLINDQWLAWRLRKGWKSQGRDINWAEMVAVELGLRTLVAGGLVNTHVIINSDNQGVVYSVRAASSRGFHPNAILRHIVGIMQEHKIWVTTQWVPSNDNLADGLSRGSLPHSSMRLPYSPDLPPHLSSFLELV